MSNLGPLTTTFTPPAACTSSFDQAYFFTDGKGIWNAQGPIDLGSCFPPSYTADPTAYYSPGLCPSNYTPACSSTNRLTSSQVETVFTCCPDNKDYTCSQEGHPGWGGCYHNLYSTDAPLSSAHGIRDGTTSSIPPITITSAGAINAQSIQVRFQSDDFSSDPTPQSSVPSHPHPTTTTTPLDSTATGSQANDDSSSSGISEGAKIGIGVGIAAVALVLAGLLIFFIKNRRQKARQSSGIASLSPSSSSSSSSPGIGHHHHDNDKDSSNKNMLHTYDDDPASKPSPSELPTERYYHEKTVAAAAGLPILNSPYAYAGSPPPPPAELDSSPAWNPSSC